MFPQISKSNTTQEIILQIILKKQYNDAVLEFFYYKKS